MYFYSNLIRKKKEQREQPSSASKTTFTLRRIRLQTQTAFQLLAFSAKMVPCKEWVILFIAWPMLVNKVCEVSSCNTENCIMVSMPFIFLVRDIKQLSSTFFTDIGYWSRMSCMKKFSMRGIKKQPIYTKPLFSYMRTHSIVIASCFNLMPHCLAVPSSAWLCSLSTPKHNSLTHPHAQIWLHS